MIVMKNKIKWNPYTDLSTFDSSINSKDENRNYNIFKYDMPIDKYIGVQENTKEIKARNEYYRITGHIQNLDYFDDTEFDKKGIPTPVLEFDVFGNKTGWQEGYKRGLYAKSKGQKNIRVYMAYQNRPGLNSKITNKKYDAFESLE